MANKDQVTIDLSGYKDKMGQRVAPGRYRVIVEDTEPDTSAAGNQMVNLWLRVVGGEFDGAVLVDRLVLTEKSLFRVVGFMQAIGLPTPKKRLQVNIRSWVNKSLFVDVEDGEPYNNKVRSEIRGYEKIRGAAASEALPDDERAAELDGLGEFDEKPDVAAGIAQEVEAEADLPEEVDLDDIQL